MDRRGLISDLEGALKEHTADVPGFSLQSYVDSGDPLPVDSMALFDVGMFLEDRFGLRLEDDQIMKMRDARVLVETVERHLAGK